jgi:hypothetical protein
MFFASITPTLPVYSIHTTQDMVIGSSRCLLDPRGKISIHWDMGIAFLLILTIFTMPLSMAFEVRERIREILIC